MPSVNSLLSLQVTVDIFSVSPTSLPLLSYPPPQPCLLLCPPSLLCPLTARALKSRKVVLSSRGPIPSSLFLAMPGLSRVTMPSDIDN